MARAVQRETVLVTDLDRSLAFYRNLLDFRVLAQSADWVELQNGQIQLGLTRSRTPISPDRLTLSLPERVFRLVEGRAYLRSDVWAVPMSPYAFRSEIQLRDPDGHNVALQCKRTPLLSLYRFRGHEMAIIGVVLCLLMPIGGLMALFHLLAEDAPAKTPHSPATSQNDPLQASAVEMPVVTVTPSAKWIGHVVTYRDQENRILKLQLDTLVGERVWRLGSTRVVEDRLGQPVDVLGFLQEYAKARPAREVVAFGTACELGEDAVETNRAFERGKTLEGWCRLSFPEATVHRVNLGQYVPSGRATIPNPSEAAQHRAVFIAEILQKDEALVGNRLALAVRSALLEAQMSTRPLPLAIESYDSFAFATPRLGLQAPGTTVSSLKSVSTW